MIDPKHLIAAVGCVKASAVDAPPRDAATLTAPRGRATLGCVGGRNLDAPYVYG